MYYFKDENGGVGIASVKKDIGAVEWITKEEYEELLKQMKEQEASEWQEQ